MKIDLKKELKHLYLPSPKEVVLVDVPRMNFLMIDGKGDPNKAQEFQEVVDALYGVSYTLKFDLKKKGIGPDYTVMPLEGLWGMEGRDDFDIDDKDNWQWTLMMMQPDHINQDLVADAAEQVKQKKDPPALPKLRFEAYEEGLSAQIMYLGPYSEEGPVIRKIHDFVKEKGFNLRGRHHEIYIGDPRRTAPERLKTVLRQPVSE